MTVELIEDGGNPHVLEKPASGDFSFDISGRVSYPSGYIDLNLYTGVDTAPYKSWSLYRYNWMIFKEHSNLNTTYNVYAKITDIESISGTVFRVYYRVDWLTTYFNQYRHDAGYDATDLAKPFRQCKMLTVNDKKYVDQWAFFDMPVTGKKTVTTVTGQSVDRFNADSAYLLVMKCSNYHASVGTYYGPQAMFMLTYSQVKALLEVLSSGDNPTYGDPGFRIPSKILSSIQGIYYLPGVTLTIDNGVATTNMSGVVCNLETASIYWKNPNGVVEALFIMSANHTNPSTPLAQIDYDNSGGVPAAAYIDLHPFDPLDPDAYQLKVSDMFDLYYKRYTMYIPYIGYEEIPVTKLFGYTQTDPWSDQQIDIDIRFYFDLYSGKFTYRWYYIGMKDQHNFVSLPEIPLLLDTSGIGMYQTNAKTDMALISAGVNGVVAAATGNAAGVLGAGMTAMGAVKSQEIGNNVSAAAAFKTVDASGMTGTSHVFFTLFIESLTKKDTIDNVIDHHGGPGISDMVPAISTACRIWLDPEDMQLVTTFGEAAKMLPFIEDIKYNIRELKYVEVKT